MVVEYLRYTVAEEQLQTFVTNYRNAADPLMESEWCQSFELCQCVEDQSKFILRIEWSSAEDHLQKFRSSDEFKRFFSHIRPYLDNIDEMRHYQQLELRNS